MFANHVIVI